ncbi:MAG: cupin domain-containing protein [Chloroflexi bacterium]|nr:cupin domain-containing protein [Chloroflexota bacterium]MYC47114.1 cupin domain-containing protein [Chloroflexota bacterium]
MSDVELRKPEVLVVREHEREVEIASGAMTRIAGVSEALTGAKGIHLAEALIPPGRCSTAHYHSNCESAIYVSAGEGLMLSGHDLEIEEVIGPGDMIYIPPGAAHQPVNTSDDQPLRLIVARNTPVELVVEMNGKGRTDC